MFSGSRRFGRYLRSLREARRLTLEDVERLSVHETEPVTRSLLSRLENGKARLSLLKLMSLARLYRVRLGSLAERLETDHELARVSEDGVPAGPSSTILDKARRAGLEGRLSLAMLLCERAAAIADQDGVARARAQLSLAQALSSAGRHRTARHVIEELSLERLPAGLRAQACLLLARNALALGQLLLAWGAYHALSRLRPPWPPDVETGAALLRAELLSSESNDEEALAAWLDALGAAQRADDITGEVRCQLRLASLQRARGASGEAMFWTRKALQRAQLRREPRLEA
ncbi:MAG: helix-turn-helix transcriptional regulator, partial [Acidobacteriota bacterium]